MRVPSYVHRCFLQGAEGWRNLLNDPPALDRSTLPAVDRSITEFFSRHLLR